MTITVTQEQSAQHLGSGTMAVFGTPALIALMEATAQQTITTLQEGETTVGISINCQHVKATAIGEEVTCVATITNIDGRKISFDIVATNAKAEVIGTATHERFVVNAEKFMAKLES